MAKGNIFVISVKEAAKEKISNTHCNIIEEKRGSDQTYKSAVHVLSILGCCGLVMSIQTLEQGKILW